MIESEVVFNAVESILFETLAENLGERSLRLLEQNHDAIVLEIHESIDASWGELIPDELEDEEWLELGAYFELQGARNLFARILFHLDMEEEKSCHIQWTELPQA